MVAWCDMGDSLILAAELGRTVDYRPVPTDGATRAATLIAEVLEERR